MYWLLDISGKISLQCMKVFKRKTQFCMLLTPVFPGRKRGGLKFTDEPTGNLDSKSSTAVIEAFLNAKETMGATIFMVTHDAFSASYADKVIALKDGVVFGELVRHGQPKDFLDELLDFTRKVNGDGYDAQ